MPLQKMVLVPFFLLVVTSNLIPVCGQESPKPDDETPFRELTIYVPYEKLRKTFEVEGRGVFLPYEKFQALWKAAREKLPKPQDVNPPVKAVITEIDNQAAVKNDVIRVSAKLTIELLDSGWIEVPLRLRDVAVLSATLDGQPALLVPGENGEQRLLLKQEKSNPSQVVLQLEYAKNISKTPGQNSVAFEAPLAPVNQWRIRIPESGVKVNVSPMLAATEELPEHRTRSVTVQDDSEDNPEKPANPANETVILAFVGAAQNVKINWTPKAEGASGLDALVSVQTTTQVVIEEGLTVSQVKMLYEISRSELPEIKVEVPADQKIINVSDPNVRQWDVKKSAESQIVTVGLFQAARNQQQVLLELEKFRDESEKQVLVPAVKAQDVDRQRGLVLVRVSDGFRVEPSRRGGFVQVDQSELPSELKKHAWAYTYRYASLPYELVLDVQRVKSKIHVDQLVEVFLQPQLLTIDLLAKYKIERAAVYELLVDLPDGFEIRSVQGQACDGTAAANVESHFIEVNADGSRSLKVNLASKAIGAVGLMVEMERRLSDANLVSPTDAASKLQISPPKVVDDFVQSTLGHMVVYMPESLRATVDQLSGLRNVTFQEAFQAVPSVRAGRFSDVRPLQAFAFAKGSTTADFSVQRRQPQVAVKQLVVTRVEPGAVKYEATLFYNIRYSSVKSLRVDLPSQIVNLVRNESKSLHEATVTPAPEDVADGYVAWTLSGETELLGNVQCKLTWEVPIAELSIGKSADIQVPRLIPREADRADGQIVLVKSETIDVYPASETTGLDPIDPQHDLMNGIKVADAAAALEFHDDWDLTLRATRYQLEVLKHTSIEQAVLRNVVTRSDRISVQALYRMRSSNQRLKIELPAEVASGSIEFDTDPLRINGNRTTLERGDDDKTFFVPLVGIDTNQPFLLELRYTIPGGAHKLTYPDFPDEPAIQKVNMVAYLPDNQKYLGRLGPWTDEIVWANQGPGQRVPKPRTNVTTLIDQLTNGIAVSNSPGNDFPTDGQPLLFTTLRPVTSDRGALRITTINGQLLHGIMFGAVAFAGVILLRRPILERIAVLCGVLAVLVLVGVFLPAFANALFGQPVFLAIGVVALLWIAVFAMGAPSKISDLRLHWPFQSEAKSTDSVAPVQVPPIQTEAKNQTTDDGGQQDA